MDGILPSMTRELEGYNFQPEDVLTLTEYELLEKSRAKQVSCPWCDLPLTGLFYIFEIEDGLQEKGVRLRCSSCGFDEW